MYFIQPAQEASRIKAANVIGLYLIALPPVPAAAEPNPWVIALQTGVTSAVVIELREADPLGHTLVVCRECPYLIQSGEVENCAKSWPLAVRNGSSISEWLDKLVVSGSTRYQLVRGVGMWLLER